MPPSHPPEALTVSQINKAIAGALEASFPEAFWVAGEVQGYDRDAAKAASRRWGQVYFELIEKEPGADAPRASARAILWGDVHAAVREKLRSLSEELRLQDGLQVKLLCAVEFYWPRASLQLKVLDVDPSFTLGGMERARQALLEKLKALELYDANRAAAMPPVPQTVGLITSDGSAAYHDFTDELRRSGYAFRVLFWDARMQGEETESSVCRGLRALGAHPEVDVIALVRGGGSRSDLIWFDREKIALGVARCPKPVVTGIGHEIDLSVADAVAHASRKTPTAAAQFLVETVRVFESGLQSAAADLLSAGRSLLRESRRDLDEGIRSWRRSSLYLLERSRAALAEEGRALSSGARRHLRVGAERLAAFPRLVSRSALERLRSENERLASRRRECELKDPRRLLARGYGLLFSGGRPVKSVEDVAEGDELEAHLRDGSLAARVTARRRAPDGRES